MFLELQKYFASKQGVLSLTPPVKGSRHINYAPAVLSVCHKKLRHLFVMYHLKFWTIVLELEQIKFC
jgi:hypothetical protein